MLLLPFAPRPQVDCNRQSGDGSTTNLCCCVPGPDLGAPDIIERVCWPGKAGRSVALASRAFTEEFSGKCPGGCRPVSETECASAVLSATGVRSQLTVGAWETSPKGCYVGPDGTAESRKTAGGVSLHSILACSGAEAALWSLRKSLAKVRNCPPTHTQTHTLLLVSKVVSMSFEVSKSIQICHTEFFYLPDGEASARCPPTPKTIKRPPNIKGPRGAP